MIGNEQITTIDFEHPSRLFLFDDILKGLLGGPLFFNPFLGEQGGFRGDEQVIDFGCGGGPGTRCIAKQLTQGGKVLGIDVSSVMIKRAEKRLRKYANAEAIKGDVRTLGLEKGAFDVITIIYVIHDIVPKERASIIKALVDLLKPDGQIWILEPIKAGHGMSIEEIRLLMNLAGLEETEHSNKKSSYRGKFKKMSIDVLTSKYAL